MLLGYSKNKRTSRRHFKCHFALSKTLFPPLFKKA